MEVHGVEVEEVEEDMVVQEVVVVQDVMKMEEIKMAAKRKKYFCKSCKHNKSGLCIIRHMQNLTTIRRCEFKVERGM